MLVVWIKYGAILSIVILYSDYNRRTVLRIGVINTQYNGMEQISSTAHLRLYSLHYPGCFRSSLRWLASSIFLQRMQIPDLQETMANWWEQNIPNIHSSQHVAKKSWMIFPAAENFTNFPNILFENHKLRTGTVISKCCQFIGMQGSESQWSRVYVGDAVTCCTSSRFQQPAEHC